MSQQNLSGVYKPCNSGVSNAIYHISIVCTCQNSPHCSVCASASSQVRDLGIFWVVIGYNLSVWLISSLPLMLVLPCVKHWSSSFRTSLLDHQKQILETSSTVPCSMRGSTMILGRTWPSPWMPRRRERTLPIMVSSVAVFDAYDRVLANHKSDSQMHCRFAWCT